MLLGYASLGYWASPLKGSKAAGNPAINGGCGLLHQGVKGLRVRRWFKPRPAENMDGVLRAAAGGSPARFPGVGLAVLATRPESRKGGRGVVCDRVLVALGLFMAGPG